MGQLASKSAALEKERARANSMGDEENRKMGLKIKELLAKEEISVYDFVWGEDLLVSQFLFCITECMVKIVRDEREKNARLLKEGD